MLILTQDAELICDHRGKMQVETSQKLVTIQQRIVLVETDPEDKRIRLCPNIGPTMKPCRKSLKVKEGYCDFIRVDGHRVCLETIKGLTDGTVPGTVNYIVHETGQKFVKVRPA
jgi:hypothetical protein